MRAQDWALYDAWWSSLRRPPRFGWKLWARTDDGRLTSPVFAHPMPDDLTITATCPVNPSTPPPHPDCAINCGTNAFPGAADIVGYIESGVGWKPVPRYTSPAGWLRSMLAEPPKPLSGDVLTFGELIGPALPPSKNTDAIPKYHRVRSRGYRVLAMVTDDPTPLAYDMPVTVAPWDELRGRLNDIVGRPGG